MYNNHTPDYRDLCRRIQELEELVARKIKDDDEMLSNLDNSNLSMSLYNDISLAKSFASKGEGGKVSLKVNSITLQGDEGTIRLVINDGTPCIEFYNGNAELKGSIYPSTGDNNRINLDSNDGGIWHFSGTVDGIS